MIDSVTPQGLANQLRAGIIEICDKAAARRVSIEPEEFASRSLITPRCGLGPTTPEISDKILLAMVETRNSLRDKPTTAQRRSSSIE